MIAAIHQPQYWPGLRFFAKMRAADIFILLDDVQYERREFQNRNRIRTAGGSQYITAPVVSKGRFTQRINEVMLDRSSAWAEQHFRALQVNYARAPFWGEWRERIKTLLESRHASLADLSLGTVEMLREGFGIKTPCVSASGFKVSSSSSLRLAELCRAAGADSYLSGAGGKAYLDEEVFRSMGLGLAYQDFKVKEYPQAFPGFVPDMSALDLLLNCGPGSSDWL